MNLSIQNIFTRVNYIKILIFSFLIIVIGFGFATFLLPRIIRMAMKMELRITPGTKTRKMFEEIPFPLHYSVYIFNVTNKEEVIAGAKPILQEIGPYYFEEYKSKYDIVDNEEEDTVEYDFRNIYHFKPGPNGLTGEEIVTVAHPFLISTIQLININRKDLVPFISRAIDGVLHNPQDIFFTGRLFTFLYDGIFIDCTSNDFEVTATCNELDGGDYPEVTRHNETTFKFAMFSHRTNNTIGRFKSLRGKKNISDLGRIVEYHGIPNIYEAWSEDECNQPAGTDGTIFPPFQEKEDGFTMFIPQMCRAFTAEYQQPSKVSGIKTNRFTFDFNVSKYGTPSCYCRDEDFCPPEGMLDLFSCLGTPILISLPHFYKVDPTEREKFIGLNPEPEKHDFTMDFYQFSGTPVQVRSRLQVNIEVVPIESIRYMKNLQPMFLPILWMETSLDMPKKYVNMLKYQLILGLKMQILMKYGSIIGGFFGLILGAIACYFQIDNERNDTHKFSADAHSNDSVIKPKVVSIEVISNEQ